MSKPMLIFAHRGARDLAPENTLEAFAKAIELKADGVETDVQVSAGGVPVLIHDALKNLDEHIPTLQAALELFSHSTLKVVLEIKRQPMPATQAVAAIKKIVTPYFGKVDILFSSFSSFLLWELKKQLPQFPRAALYDTRVGLHLLSRLEVPFLQASAITPFHKHVTSDFVRWAKKQNLPLYAWTVNTPEAMWRMQEFEIDGIMTDHVELAQKTLLGYKRSYG